MAQIIHRNALPAGYRLLWYEVDRVLGQGGFGITYLARDTNLDQSVAIKEYLPAELAMREADDSVHPVSSDRDGHFRTGLADFVREGRTLARFDHPNIVRVHSVFEANNTAYMVMRYESGKSLEALLPRRGTLDEARLTKILHPILDGLRLVHEAGFIHRDIKPANIFVREDGSPVLLDFGSARQALGEADRTLTSLVTPGYAPFEQYHGRGERQGPWTDIYALGATLYRAIVGVAPMDAMDRSERLLANEQDPLVRATEAGAGRYRPRFLQAVDRALAFRDDERPRGIDAWIGMLPGSDEAPGSGAEAGLVDDPFTLVSTASGSDEPGPFGIIEFPEEPGDAGSDAGVEGEPRSSRTVAGTLPPVAL